MLFIFLLLVIISCLRNSVALYLNKLESISLKKFLQRLIACSSWEEDFLKVVNILIFTIFAIITFWKRVVLYLNKLEFPSFNDALCYV